jgi:hypothetical protein
MPNFDNPPEHVSKDRHRKQPNPLPIRYSFNPISGNYFRDGNEFSGLPIFQPICYRWQYTTRDRLNPKHWFDVLFLTRFNQLGILSLPDLHGCHLSDRLEMLKARSICSYGVWLVMNRRFEVKSYQPYVNSFYWASRWDCMNAEHTLFDLKTKSWSQPDE